MTARTAALLISWLFFISFVVAQDRPADPEAPTPGDPLAEILPPVPELLPADDVMLQGKKVSEWFKLFEDNDADNRMQAIAVVVQAKTIPAPTVPLLCRVLLKDADPQVRMQAAVAITYAKREATVAAKSLAHAVGDSDPSVQEEALNSLGYLGPLASPAVEQIAKLASDDTSEHQLFAFALLARMGVRAKPVIDVARKAMSSSNAKVREAGFCVVTAMGPEGAEAVPELLAYLKAEVKAFVDSQQKSKDDPFKSGSNNTRMDQMILFACRLGPAVLKGFPDMLAALRAEPTQLVKWPEAVRELGPEVVPQLIAAARVEADYVAMQCVSALYCSMAQECPKDLASLITDRKDCPQLREAAVVALAFSESAGIEAEPVLLKVARTDKYLKSYAIQSLGLIRAKSEETVEFLRTYCDETTEAALLGFGLPALYNATGDAADIIKRMPRNSVDRHVLNLVEMMQENALPLLGWLRERLKESTSEWEQKLACDAIAVFGKKGAEAVPELRQALEAGPESSAFIPAMGALAIIGDRDSRGKIRKHIFAESLVLAANSVWATTKLGGDVGMGLPKLIERLGEPGSPYMVMPTSYIPADWFGPDTTVPGLWEAFFVIEDMADKASEARDILRDYADAHNNMAYRVRAAEVLAQLKE